MAPARDERQQLLLRRGPRRGTNAKLRTLPVRAAGSAHGSAVALGKGFRGKGAFPHGAARAQAMAKATAVAARATTLAGLRKAGPERPRPEKRAREEMAANALGGGTPSGVPRARAAYGESASRRPQRPCSRRPQLEFPRPQPLK